MNTALNTATNETAQNSRLATLTEKERELIAKYRKFYAKKHAAEDRHEQEMLPLDAEEAALDADDLATRRCFEEVRLFLKG